MKNLKPFFYENSIFPRLLAKIAPINVWAVSIGPFVWCRGELSDITKQHETIHFQQQLEMAFIAQWILYFTFYALGRIKHGSWKEAYYQNPFEKEAYAKQDEKDYLKNRKRYSWLEYIK